MAAGRFRFWLAIYLATLYAPAVTVIFSKYLVRLSAESLSGVTATVDQSFCLFVRIYASSLAMEIKICDGHCTMVPFLNSLVHVVMYFYYFLTSLDDSYRKYMWWKKHITQLQIVQFLLLIIHFGQLLFNNPCNFPSFALSVIIPQNVFMLILFSDFYIKAYLKKKK